MYRFCAFFMLGMFVLGGQAVADQAIAPVEPPKVEGMVTESAPETEPVTPPRGAEDLPGYRGAQKPDLPEVKNP